MYDHIECAHAFRFKAGFINIEIDTMGYDFCICKFFAYHIHATPARKPEVFKYDMIFFVSNTADFKTYGWNIPQSGTTNTLY